MSTKDIQILLLNHIQKESWLQLWQAYQTFYEAKISKEISENTWRKLTDDQCAHMYGFAAIDDGQVVGIVHIIEHDSCWTVQPYAYLQDLYVDDQFRNQGIARQLIEFAQRAAKDRNCDRLYWLTHESNETAQLLYDRVACKTGFIQYRCP